jgi:hypothetical protein
MLPSRAYDTKAGFDANGNPDMVKNVLTRPNPLEFTTDGGAGGVELLNWYDNHKDLFGSTLPTISTQILRTQIAVQKTTGLTM